jgi:hypothetical protein
MGWANDSSSRRRFISDNAVLRVCLAKISVVPEPASIEIFCFLANSGPSPDAAKNKFPTNPKKKPCICGCFVGYPWGNSTHPPQISSVLGLTLHSTIHDYVGCRCEMILTTLPVQRPGTDWQMEIPRGSGKDASNSFVCSYVGRALPVSPRSLDFGCAESKFWFNQSRSS